MPQINDIRSLPADQQQAIIAQIVELLGQPAAHGLPVSVPSRRLKTKKNERISYLTDEELRRLFAAIGGNVRDQAIFELALGRGLRASEVPLITMDRLRMRDRRLYVERLKNGISNEYLLFEREMKALRAWLRVRGDDPGPLFPSTHRRPISYQRLDQMIHHYARIAQLPPEKSHFHCLRHTCATRLLEHGARIEQVKDHLGHRDIRNTMIYAQVTDRSRKELAKRLEREW
jgi:integrase